MVEVVEVTLGKSTYSVAKDTDPTQVGGVDRFIPVQDGRPLIVRRSNGQDFFVTYKSKRAARTTALALNNAGLRCRVWDKEEQRHIDD